MAFSREKGRCVMSAVWRYRYSYAPIYHREIIPHRDHPLEIKSSWEIFSRFMVISGENNICPRIMF